MCFVSNEMKIRGDYRRKEDAERERGDHGDGVFRDSGRRYHHNGMQRSSDRL
jgi:hypothetical protein